MRIILTCLCFLLFQPSISQHTFKGRLLDDSTEQGVADANILIAGSSHGTVTDSLGYFSLEYRKKTIVVIVSHLSYNPDRFEINSKGFNELTATGAHILLDHINLRLGEYDGPGEYIEFDASEYSREENERASNYLNGEEFVIVEDPAAFFGGMANLKAYFAKNFHYPAVVLEQNLEGELFAVVRIHADGTTTLQDIKFLGKDPEDRIGIEIERMISAMPPWHPPLQRGKPVGVTIVIPVKYAANGYKIN